MEDTRIYASGSESPNVLFRNIVKQDVLLSSAVEESITEDVLFAIDNDDVGDGWGDGLGFSQLDDLEDPSSFVETELAIPLMQIKQEPFEIEPELPEEASVTAGYTLEFVPYAFPVKRETSSPQMLSPPLTPDSRHPNYPGDRVEFNKISKSKSAHGKYPKSKRAFLYKKEFKDCKTENELKQVIRAKNTKEYHETVKKKVCVGKAAMNFFIERDPTCVTDLKKRNPALFDELMQLYPSFNNKVNM